MLRFRNSLSLHLEPKNVQKCKHVCCDLRISCICTFQLSHGTFLTCVFFLPSTLLYQMPQHFLSQHTFIQVFPTLDPTHENAPHTLTAQISFHNSLQMSATSCLLYHFSVCSVMAFLFFSARCAFFELRVQSPNSSLHTLSATPTFSFINHHPSVLVQCILLFPPQPMNNVHLVSVDGGRINQACTCHGAST